MKQNRWRTFLLAAVLAGLAGSALHFLHDALPNPLTALISPVNESVFEHLKLLFWPSLAAGAFLARRTEQRAGLWSAVFAGVLAMPVFLLGVYYVLFCALGIESLAADIALYFLALLAGFGLAWRLDSSGRAERAGGFLLMLVILYGAALILFTFAAPALPLFQAP